MRKKNYNVGDRVFYELFDVKGGEIVVTGIGSGIVTAIEERHGVVYDDGKKRIEDDYQMLYFCDPNSNVRTAIESYNCLPKSNPRVKEELKKFKDLDKKRNELYKMVSAKWNIPTEKAQDFIKEILNIE